MITLHGTFPRLLVLVGFCLVLGGIFALGGLALSGPLFGVELENLSALTQDLSSPESIQILKLIQLFNTVGLFVLPALLFSLLFIQKPLNWLKVNQSSSAMNFGLVLLLMFSILPAMNWLVEWNQGIQLPEAFSGLEAWMKGKEAGAMELTKAFLRMETTNDLWINLILIALLPALGEELIFRGIVQQTINKGRQNPHLGIWVSALLFSALHMQFYGFFPRMILGAFFGYLLVWGKSLWLPIFAHFINNATAVIIAYKLGVEGMEKEFDQIGASESTYLISLVGILIFSSLLWVFYRRNRFTE
ncbi:MAG: type II CAAX endopeptidase family protein [Vicingaceae bacterium]